MAPSLFKGLAATDETTWCAELGREAPERLRAHWEHFVTREDFAWLAGVGINTVRIGWFFWSYRTETTPEWCFRECVERGWLPPRFQ